MYVSWGLASMRSYLKKADQGQELMVRFELGKVEINLKTE